jgi:hypothetical protein
MENEQQFWFLIKENWKDFIFTLSDEEAGKFIKAIYSGEVPSGTVGAVYQSVHQEFMHVNEGRIKRKERYKTLAKLGNEARWNKVNSRDNDGIPDNSSEISSYDISSRDNPVGSPTLTLTPTPTLTQKVNKKDNIDSISGKSLKELTPEEVDNIDFN